MKDDFYKDLNQKRAQDEADKKTSKCQNDDNKADAPLSRGSRLKNKDNDKKKDEKNEHNNSLTEKVKGYFSPEKNQARKAYFVGQFNNYQNRIKKEIKISKEKLSSKPKEEEKKKTSLAAAATTNKKNQTNKTEKKKESNQDTGSTTSRGKLPWVLGLIVLIPLTVLLAFLIFSNFWPSLDDEIELASEEANTEESVEENKQEDNENQGFNEELEEQKKEHERRLAEGRNEDLSTQDLDLNYSEAELEKLEEESRQAIETKGETDSSEEESATNSNDDTADNTEESTNNNSTNSDSTSEDTTEAEVAETEMQDEETSDDSTDEEQTNANASHTVTTEDNLYRIAIQYYGDGSSENVQRIREANGISENEISVGQTLIIP